MLIASTTWANIKCYKNETEHTWNHLKPLKTIFCTWFSATMTPLESIRQMGDIFLAEYFGSVFWKKPFQGVRVPCWTAVFDDDPLVHPCDPNLHLVVQKNPTGKKCILWKVKFWRCVHGYEIKHPKRICSWSRYCDKCDRDPIKDLHLTIN